MCILLAKYCGLNGALSGDEESKQPIFILVQSPAADSVGAMMIIVSVLLTDVLFAGLCPIE